MFGVEFAMRHKIWVPPERPKPRRDDTCDAYVKTIRGDRIHLRIFSPDPRTNLQTYSETVRRLVIYFHGNAEDLHGCDSFLAWLSTNTDQNVLGVEYVGYGKSTREREPTEGNMHEVADAALYYACNTLGHKMHTITVVGRSLGSIPAVHLASQRMNAGLGGLVLISALASGARCMLPVAYIPASVMGSLDGVFGGNILRMGDVQCMVLLVHGDKDKEVPLDNAQALYHKCHQWCLPQLYVVEGGGHNDLLDRHGKEILRQLNAFTEQSAETARLRSSEPEARTPYESLIEF
jgi:pimeloyl-ACP methyl ester carboxylesterase